MSDEAKTEQRLQRFLARLYRRLDTIGVAQVGMDGTILNCNGEFARIMGDDPMHLEGKSVIELTSPEDQERARKNLHALSTGEVESIKHDKRYMNRVGQSIKARCQFIAVRRETMADYITSFIFEFDWDSDLGLRVAELERYIDSLLQALAKQQGVNISVSGNDNRQTATADNGATASISNNRQAPIIVVALAVVAIAISAFVFGGSFSGSVGDTEVEVESKDK